MLISAIRDKLCKYWNLELVEVARETNSSDIYFVKREKQFAVLKIFKCHSDEKQSSQVLQSYGGNGAVAILEMSEDSVLLERLTPGITLTDLVVSGKDDIATKIFCKIVEKLHSVSFDTKHFRHLSALISTYDLYLKSGSTIVSTKVVMHARFLFKQLIESQSSEVLLHGDLHHDNILQDDVRGWVSIDPKGYIGEREFEASNFLKNPKG